MTDLQPQALEPGVNIRGDVVYIVDKDLVIKARLPLKNWHELQFVGARSTVPDSLKQWCKPEEDE
jgi:hypothetical protein